MDLVNMYGRGCTEKLNRQRGSRLGYTSHAQHQVCVLLSCGGELRHLFIYTSVQGQQGQQGQVRDQNARESGKGLHSGGKAPTNDCDLLVLSTCAKAANGSDGKVQGNYRTVCTDNSN